MFVVGVITLSNSKEGEAVGIDLRPRVAFPETPNALVAATDEAGRLASLVVVTLLPDGQGGSIVAVPVNADATAGFGLQRRPIVDGFDASDIDGLVSEVEGMLSITVQMGAIVDVDALAAGLPQPGSMVVQLPNDVIDTVGGGGVIALAGPQSFTAAELADVLVAIDDDAPAQAAHDNDVAVWSALASAAPVDTSDEVVQVDAAGRPIAPETVDDLLARLWQGEVSVRDLLVVPEADVENPTNVDVALIDRRDSTLVFAQVSPALVSTPNTGLKARIVATFTDDELAEARALYGSTADLAAELIGRLIFLTGNVVSVDTEPAGVPAITIIEVADESQLQETIDAADALLGAAEVRLAETVLEGVDVQVILGMSYLEHELERAESLGAVATSADATGTVDGNG